MAQLRRTKVAAAVCNLEAAAERLRTDVERARQRAVLWYKLHPNQPLTKHDLAELTGIKTVVAWTALKELAAEGALSPTRRLSTGGHEATRFYLPPAFPDVGSDINHAPDQLER